MALILLDRSHNFGSRITVFSRVGSVATVKARELCSRLLELGDLRVVSTFSARKFLEPGDIPLESLPLLGVSEVSGDAYTCACMHACMEPHDLLFFASCT